MHMENYIFQKTQKTTGRSNC